jgi:diaminohydroxyphosphoribosylaminopyrimidine deaminase / 5-amino-6-(5-phosphoribosylamino)uracil reductase
MLPRTNPHPPGTDEFYMHRALELALGGLGWTSPNPLVGCVLVRAGNIIAEGWHQRDGQEHAEVLALRACSNPRGATAYVNLEPCGHVGRQPACCAKLAEAGIARVVYGSEDANPITRGLAREWLPQHGIAVSAGVLREDCNRLLDYYLHSHRTDSAFIHLKLALSLDGKAACANGQSQWLSGPASLGLAHFLRQQHDGVLVSARTALADRARLSVRLEQLGEYYCLPPSAPPRQPVRIILDPRFELADRLAGLPLADPAGAWRGHLPQLVLAGRKDKLPGTPPRLSGLRVELLGLDCAPGGPLAWARLAVGLRELGIGSVLVEGGPGLAAEMLRQRAADKLTLVHTPRLLGADGIGFTPDWGAEAVGACPRLAHNISFGLGDDCIVSGYPEWC